MGKQNMLTDKEQVDAFILKLEPEHRALVQALRQIILNTSPKIAEHIKWNSPAMYYNGELKAFDAKAYTRDLIVFNLHRGRTLLVLPTGDKIPDPQGILEGNYPDGRRLITIHDPGDIEKKAEALRQIILEWLILVVQ